MSENKRNFKYVDQKTGETIGRFTGNNPRQAAAKAATSIIRHKRSANLPTDSVFLVRIQETTNGGSKKIYEYDAQEVELDKPKIINRDGNKINFTRKILIKSHRPDSR